VRRVATKFKRLRQRQPVRIVKDKNPVKVIQSKKGLSFKDWKQSTCFWILTKLKRIAPNVLPRVHWQAKSKRFLTLKKTLDKTYDMPYGPQGRVGGFRTTPPTKKVVIQATCLQIFEEVSKPRRFIRKGANRKEKRRSWVTERVLKKVPESIKRMVSPREYRVAVSEARSCKGVLHSHWIQKRVESMVENRQEVKLLFKLRRAQDARSLKIRKVSRVTQYANWPFRKGGFCTNRAFAFPQTAYRRRVS
jgi:hypothetical protein